MGAQHLKAGHKTQRCSVDLCACAWQDLPFVYRELLVQLAPPTEETMREKEELWLDQHLEQVLLPPHVDRPPEAARPGPHTHTAGAHIHEPLPSRPARSDNALRRGWTLCVS